MDRVDFLLSLTDRINELYDDLTNSELVDIQEIANALEHLQSFNEELETLMEE